MWSVILFTNSLTVLCTVGIDRDSETVIKIAIIVQYVLLLYRLEPTPKATGGPSWM